MPRTQTARYWALLSAATVNTVKYPG